MVKGFWKKIKKPIFTIAPMANVTDAAFRSLIAKYGKPDVMWTEFVSCDGLQSVGKEKIMIDLKYDKKERPIVAQIFGSNPENCYKTAILIRELGFDGIDINMGCPDRAVERQGAGAALIKNPKLAQEIILATMRGAGDLPVSVKTRIGYNKDELKTWLPVLLETHPAAITIHARTRKEMSKVPARWEHITEAIKIRDKFDQSPDHTLILGNGDIDSVETGIQKAKETGADGIMIGRGIFGDPWCFADLKKLKAGKKSTKKITVRERLSAMCEHAALFEKMLDKEKNFEIMKKHFKAYANGFANAKELRIQLMEEVKNSKDVKRIVKNWLKNNPVK